MPMKPEPSGQLIVADTEKWAKVVEFASSRPSEAIKATLSETSI